MRHPRSLHRPLGRPRERFRPGGPLSRPPGHLTAPRPLPTDRTGGPDVYARRSPESAVADQGHPTSDRRRDAAWLLGAAAWLTAVAGTVALLAQVGARPDVLALGVLLAVVPALVPPHRARQVLAALVGVLLLPVLLLISLVVRLTSRGSVLVRDGHGDDREPSAVRFRTTAPADPASTTSDGGHLTPVGRILRALGLDELPRLIDVARGEAPLRRTIPH